MKELKNILNLDYLQDRLAFANTPMYLYKNYQKDESILKLSKFLSIDELINIFNKVEEKADKNLTDFVLIYAIIIALTFKNSTEVKPFFIELAQKDIKWGRHLSEIYFAKVRIDNNNSFDLKYSTGIKTEFNQFNSSSRFDLIENIL